jgi:putative membrane protein
VEGDKCQRYSLTGDIGGGKMMMGFGLIGVVLMILFWGGLILGAVWLVRAVFQPGNQFGSRTQSTQEQSARDILDRRYARGEITREQYEAMRKDLET